MYIIISTTPNLRKTTTGSTKQHTPINSKEVSLTSGLEDLRKICEKQGISERSSKLIAGAKRQCATSSYESASRKWSHWCGDPVRYSDLKEDYMK